ncbi:hypothetical protein BS50DRAFT_73675 [Corynespora cassiicola Philippines]|uniref:Uncharacterized protein n=1 Tax=Corynespora cassiicola Philippines TaxID=1448308 RepID=A0A2T2NG69_CORCC|nr:hypothetical protein BS50DRAFT_73675 [Corynespora cassiicola Philippines]
MTTGIHACRNDATYHQPRKRRQHPPTPDKPYSPKHKRRKHSTAPSSHHQPCHVGLQHSCPGYPTSSTFPPSRLQISSLFRTLGPWVLRRDVIGWRIACREGAFCEAGRGLGA